MSGVGDEVVEEPTQLLQPRQYTILKQRVDLDIGFATRSLKGSTEITLQPLVKDLKQIRLHCRQCRPNLVQAGGINAKWEHKDPYRRLRMPSKSNVMQHDMLKAKADGSLRPVPDPELTISLPPKLKIQELHVDQGPALPLVSSIPNLSRKDSDVMGIAETPTVPNIPQQGPQFAPIKLNIEFEVENFRDGIHWIGCDEGDRRYPHLYTKLEPWPGNASCIFPCHDEVISRCNWEIALRCPKTLGDAFKRSRLENTPGVKDGGLTNGDDIEMTNGIGSRPAPIKSQGHNRDNFLIDLSEEEAGMDLTILCVGEPTDDITDSEDDTRRTVTFTLNEVAAPRHLAFAVGPFEHVDLTVFRASEEEEKLGQTAIKVEAYCLPGRVDELENTCVPICQAIDHMGVNYGRFPFPSYQMLFVDDLIHDTLGAAGLSICSTRLLFPQDIVEPLDKNTRVLIRAVADQWSGVNIVPRNRNDAWVIAGIAGYMTDVFMKKLAGNNEYRWQQKIAAEKVYDLDVDRPSIWQLGNLLHLDPSIREFLNLKSALVLGILDRRLLKSSGSTGVMRIISKIFLNATTGTLVNGELSTQDFQKTCEKLGHNKLEAFFKQWVMGAGCPIFYVTQRFNKKKLVVEMTIVQKQLERVTKPPFDSKNFMREVREHVQEVWAPEPQNVFTGPMTIRIHEADGTPYEHIVEIREPLTRLEIPYNTKYKRLKRSRRQKERAIAEGNAAGEGGEDALLYCLGDILDTPEDSKEWNLADWTAEDEEKMGQESYEWIRMDADFEWIGKIHLVMPLYMYISQLQQDRDLVAHYESMRYLLGSNPHHVSLTILIRTLMDSRYFHGIRVMAAEGLALLGKDSLHEIGQHHLMKAFSDMFCDKHSIMPRPNDFSSRETFIMQCAIPRALANLRDADNKVPVAVRRFFVDKLKFNDNSDNAYSDCHYVATLMTCLTDSLVASHREHVPTYHFAFGEEEPLEPENLDADFEKMAVNEIERYRRIDEWILTYQNIYSTTAIECLQKLTKAGVVKDKTKELLQYTRPSTAENVRLEAFSCLNEIGMTRRMPMMRHLLHSAVDDRSPYFRDALRRCFGEALGHIALGDHEVEKPEVASLATDGLVVEQEVSNETRRIESTRKTTPEGAVAALKNILRADSTFQQALWYAATSPELALDEVVAFCDIAALIYDSVTSYTVTMKLPRPYRCQDRGNGKVRFYQYGSHYRTVPTKGLSLDDYLNLENYGLRYNGPLSAATKKHTADKQQRDQADALKLQIAQTQQQLQSAQTAVQGDQTPSASTPSVERSGFKLSLGLGGAAKRKASVDLSQQRDASPKAPKLSKASTPSSIAQNSQTKKTAADAQRRSSTPITKASGGKQKKIVTLRYGKGLTAKVQHVLSETPKPSPAVTASISSQSALQKPSRSITPVLPKQTSPFPQPPSLLQSPTGSAFFNSSEFAQPPTLNLGGFRSYGPAADTANVVVSPAAEVKNENSDTSSPLSITNLPPAPPSLTSASPPAVGDGVMGPPPKPKLKLRLSSKPAGGGQSSPD